MVRAVTFDFWNTIARAPAGAMTEARHRAVAAACEASEIEVEAELLAATLEEVGRSWERSWAAGEHFPPGRGAEMLVRALALEGTAVEAVSEAFLTATRETRVETAPGIGECLQALAARGIAVGIVCDVGFAGGELLRDLLHREGLLEHFSGWGFSDEVGHYKPAPQIFEAALAALGVLPSAAMHVGDLRRTDVAGAAALGMRTVRYRGLHDDAESARVEAEFVVDSHAELPGIVDAVRRGRPKPAA